MKRPVWFVQNKEPTVVFSWVLKPNCCYFKAPVWNLYHMVQIQPINTVIKVQTHCTVRVIGSPPLRTVLTFQSECRWSPRLAAATVHWQPSRGRQSLRILNTGPVKSSWRPLDGRQHYSSSFRQAACPALAFIERGVCFLLRSLNKLSIKSESKLINSRAVQQCTSTTTDTKTDGGKLRPGHKLRSGVQLCAPVLLL